MPTTISIPSILVPAAGGAAVHAVTGETVDQALGDLQRRYPALTSRLRDPAGAPHPFVAYYVNDEDIRFLGGFAAPVKDGDEITIVSAVAGG